MNFREYLKNNIVYLDGGMGTLLQDLGLKPGEYPEKWNISQSHFIIQIHKLYFNAGSNVVCTNTFGANSLKFNDDELEKIIKAAVENAKKARDFSNYEEAKKLADASAYQGARTNREKFIALDVGPTGKLLKPLGDLDFEEAVSIFAKTIKLGVKYGVDLILIETMNDSYETKAALLAAKENSDLPVIVTNAYGEDGKLMTGATPSAMVAMLEGMGVDAFGANCSLGPKQLRKVAEELIENASVPVVLKPNAGLPKSVDGETVFDVTEEEFAEELALLLEKGLRVVGGCCGTTPEYIEALYNRTCKIAPRPIEPKNTTMVSSYTHAVKFGEKPVLIGERINPTGKKRFKQALVERDINYILAEGVNQEEKGVHILDVNVGLPDIDEVKMIRDVVYELQAVTNLPLQIDTSNIEAMEAALRRYNGKAMINSVSGKEESMKAVFPLVKKYGGVVVALTLDENGIPATAEGRVAIAKKILAAAKEYGINKKDIVFDTLAMTISADNQAALATLGALKTIKNEFGCHTSLGVSNVSFGLPNRDAINSTFFALALENGLSAAIMNPYSVDMRKTYYTYNALKGLDENCADYIEVAGSIVATPVSTPVAAAGGTTIQTNGVVADNVQSDLQYAIIKGFKDKAASLTKEILANKEPLIIVNDEIIPALNVVGKGFEDKTVYLPQLLMSAEAAKSAFEMIKAHMAANDKSSTNQQVETGQQAKANPTIVIATVHGDIHDIGKNIVKLLMENYGFNVVDLGKDIAPESIVQKVIDLHADYVGLSALMTTTVPAMEETIKQLKDKAPWCKTLVGGAVLTQEYADRIGAEKYAKDAMDGVRYVLDNFFTKV